MPSQSPNAGVPYRDPSVCPRLNVGGQAVIEGVMMRSPRCLAVAVRRANSEIVVREQPWKSSFATAIMKIPFVRGGLVLVESMRNGYEALRFSAEQFEKDLPESERTEDSQSGAASRLGVVFSLALFVALPKLLTWATGQLSGHPLGMADPRFHILAGFFKLAIFVTLISLMRRNAEMLRVFQYHGAEHKAIAAYESGEELTVANAQRHSTRHARCGTTFLMVVVLVSVAVFAMILPLILPANGGLANVILSIFISIPLLFPIAGLSYELQRLGARFTENPIAKLFLYPGYLVQGLSTAEPTDDQVEIALSALRVTLTREAENAPAPETPTVQTFADYARLSTEYGL
ncbi:MAG: DUF1385 domain-containing protein [Polyangiales bacterium]